MIRPEPRCAMCNNTPVDHGMLCPTCRAEDQAFTDQREPKDQTA